MLLLQAIEAPAQRQTSIRTPKTPETNQREDTTQGRNQTQTVSRSL